MPECILLLSYKCFHYNFSEFELWGSCFFSYTRLDDTTFQLGVLMFVLEYFRGIWPYNVSWDYSKPWLGMFLMGLQQSPSLQIEQNAKMSGFVDANKNNPRVPFWYMILKLRTCTCPKTWNLLITSDEMKDAFSILMTNSKCQNKYTPKHPWDYIHLNCSDP